MIDRLDPNTTWPCPRCKVPQVISAMYCANCGLPLGAVPPGPPDAPLPTRAWPSDSRPVPGTGRLAVSATKQAVPVILVAAAALVITLFMGSRIWSSPSRDLAPAPADPGGQSSGVQWQDYNPSLQSQLDQLRAAKDCAGLQSQFDTADANNAATMSRTGHNNAQLMGYIDTAMRSAGCY